MERVLSGSVGLPSAHVRLELEQRSTARRVRVAARVVVYDASVVADYARWKATSPERAKNVDRHTLKD